MRLTPRRIAVGLLSTAVAATLATVPNWAHADEIAAAEPVNLVVGYRNGGAGWAGAKRFVEGMRTKQLGGLNATRLQVPASRSASIMAQLRADPDVSYVEVDHRRKASDVTPNDPKYSLQPELQRVNLPAAWEVTTGSPVKIAVVDTGVTPVGDLTDAVLPGHDFVNNDSDAADDVGHGTTVASLIAARGNNGEGMAGVCWQCQILPVKVLDSDGSGLDSTIAEGITYAIQQGAKIINLSLGGPDYSQVLADAIAHANDVGVLVVSAAGNESSTAYSYPAAFKDVLAVGATDGADRAWFSNYNGSTKWVDVAAPGIVLGMNPAGEYNPDQAGTSFSSPIVAGIAGLIETDHPSYTGWSMMNALQSSATPIGSWVTYGQVDAAKALTVGTDTAAPTSTGITPAQNAKLRGTITVTPAKLADNWSGIRDVTLYVDGAWKGWSKVSPYSVKWNSAGRNGPVKLRMRIYDKAGNVLYLDRTIIADNTAPAVKVTSAPKSGSKIKGTVKVSYTGSDKYGISRYQLLVNGKVVQTHSTTKYPFTFVASKYPKTNIRVQVRAYDVAGNSSTTTARVYHR